MILLPQKYYFSGSFAPGCAAGTGHFYGCPCRVGACHYHVGLVVISLLLIGQACDVSVSVLYRWHWIKGRWRWFWDVEHEYDADWVKHCMMMDVEGIWSDNTFSFPYFKISSYSVICVWLTEFHIYSAIQRSTSHSFRHIGPIGRFSLT